LMRLRKKQQLLASSQPYRERRRSRSVLVRPAKRDISIFTHVLKKWLSRLYETRMRVPELLQSRHGDRPLR
jgi:hypothetical protein